MVIVDDLSNSSALAVDRVRTIVGLAADDARLTFYEANILDREALDAHLRKRGRGRHHPLRRIQGRGESVAKPLEYYWNNVAARWRCATWHARTT